MVIVINKDQPVARERWTGPCGVAEGSVVPRKPGNSSGGKGSQLKTDARSDEGHGALTMSLATPGCCSGVADGVTRNIVSLFREPDAGNLPVRCDEREQETESSQTGLRRAGRKPSPIATGRLQPLRLFSTLLKMP